MSKATGETEHLKDMLVGNILAVSRAEVAKTALLYGGIGLFHYIFRKKFLLISTNLVQAEESGMSIRLWDFLFYASFGFVVTSSVAIAGVLLVFCYLIVPSVGAMLFADKIGRRLAIGWTMGTLVSALGIYFSVLADLPTGATIGLHFWRRADLDVFHPPNFLSRRTGAYLRGSKFRGKENGQGAPDSRLRQHEIETRWWPPPMGSISRSQRFLEARQGCDSL